MKEKNVVFPRGLCGFLAVLLLSMVSVLFPQTAQGYTFKPAPEVPEISQNSVDDPYYAELVERFPQHQKTIDVLYADYSGWVIALAQEYGIAPLLAMEALPEKEYPGLFRDAGIFNDIYKSLDPKVLSETERAVLALRLTNVFLLRDPEKEYLEAFWKAQEQDRRASQGGVPSRRMTERFFSQGSYPENLWQELKKDSRGYDLLLELLSLEDREFLEALVQYPNGASFLLNTGNEGIRLLEESDGEILALSCFLSHEEQRALPELCFRYPQLPKVLGASGFEAYFVVMVDPNFFFNLVRAISGPEESKYLLAHAVLSRQMEAWEDPQELGKFLNSLSIEEKDCLAFYVADFLDRFESSMEDEEAALPLAPLYDPHFFTFVHAYGEKAVCLSQRFGDLLPLGQIMMEDWRGEIRDITPVLNAIQDFGEMGLQAALEFRFNERMQDLVLGSLSGNRKRDALMFLFYADSNDDRMGLSKNMGDWEKIMKKLLLECKAEEHTGRPVPLEGGVEMIEFVPGYDIVKVIHDAVAYGQTPTFGAITFAALDLVELVPLAWGTTTIVKNVAQQGVKASALRYAKRHALRSAKSALQRTTGLLDDAARSVKKMSLSDIRRRGRSLIRGVQNLPGLMGRGTLQARDACVIIIKASSNVKIQDIKSLFSYMGDLAKASGRTVRNLYGRTEHYLTGLSSRPWMVRHATEAVMNGTVVEMLVQPTMFYFGALGIMDILEDRQQLQQLIQERHEAQRIY